MENSLSLKVNGEEIHFTKPINGISPAASAEALAFADALEAVEPILTPYQPKEWRDFRDPMPTDWRMGLFLGKADGHHDFKVLIGSAHAAHFVAANLTAMIGKFFHSAPFIQEPDSPNSYWRVSFSIADADLVPLTECLRPTAGANSNGD